jgi:hypothetical protein
MTEVTVRSAHGSSYGAETSRTRAEFLAAMLGMLQRRFEVDHPKFRPIKGSL